MQVDGCCTQPPMPSHSVMHSASQVYGIAEVHTPALHESLAVHMSPSLHPDGGGCDFMIDVDGCVCSQSLKDKKQRESERGREKGARGD